MLEPSSSEDESDRAEDQIESVSAPSHNSRAELGSGVPNNSSITVNQFPPSSSSPVPGRSVSPAGVESHPSSSNDRLYLPSGRGSAAARPISPSPSTLSDSKEKSVEDAEREEAERKTRLQLYVFVIRCISYPFNAKQPNDMTRRLLKVQKEQLEKIQTRVQAFLKGELQLASDEAFFNAIQHYHDVFLNTDRVQLMVKGGASSVYDFKEIFRMNIEKQIRSLPEIDGLSKETMLSSWMTKFDTLIRGDDDSKKSSPASSTASSRQQQQSLASELILSKEQLYDMFQAVLSIKKFEHVSQNHLNLFTSKIIILSLVITQLFLLLMKLQQLLFNALQVRSAKPRLPVRSILMPTSTSLYIYLLIGSTYAPSSAWMGKMHVTSFP